MKNTYELVELYHSTVNRGDFVGGCADFGIDEAVAKDYWELIDAATDIAPTKAQHN